MSVHLTKIYTRTGDDGTTGLANFDRVSKLDARLEAYADCDEANTILGIVLTAPSSEITPEMYEVIRRIQNDLFDAGADLATPVEPNPKFAPLRVTAEYIAWVESCCDHFNEGLPTLDSFILPGGTVASAHLHHARAVVRRAERSAWRAVETYPETTSALPAKYLNRLSDLLFILARAANTSGDTKWVPGKDRYPSTGEQDESAEG